jgi:D-alanyl-D-alanine carboxypeptidase
VQVAAADPAAPVLPLPAPSFRTTDDGDDDAPADPQIGVGDVDTVDTVASLAPQPAERPMDLGVQPAVAAVDNATDTQGRLKRLDQVVGTFTSSYSMGAAPAPLGQTRASAPLIPPVGVGKDGQPIDLMTSGSISGDTAAVRSDAQPDAVGADQNPQVAEAQPQQAMPAALPQGWVVQIGAAPTRDGANGLLSDASGKVRALGRFDSFVVQFDKDGQTFFRARFGGFSGQSAANDMCKQLKQAKMSCLAMQS